MGESVLYESSGEIVTITINRPHVRNSIDGPTALTLRNAFRRFDDDAGAKVAILTGAGGTFCAGADLTSVGDPERRNDLDPEGGGAGPMGPTRMTLSKPVIAAIAGHAVAGGLELALLADLRIVERDAVLGVFCRRWGVPLIDGGTVRLPRIVGLGRALDLIMTGRPVDADEALAIGLANRVVESGRSLSAARELAEQLVTFPFECLLTDRASAYAGLDMTVADALRAEGVAGVPVVAREGAAGAARFVGGAGRHGQFDEDPPEPRW
ncbi:crotonase/enoyl-CoA hydratase family protein [Gordonia desulfuricans]|uniref:Crotonase/enoyl-CoA hydratase family protein n=1 Tax=Gordonia desulfuricans TaxID=89051 RepID=A0A7K3LL56_9ACTN|nr:MULTISPECIES: crotonase/enoyl-CoA hydratase family protein [Gordonia]EMP13146.1 enoyl-CoA hydratase [Gordonia sp. NB41Y]NDK88267.1 crotonase/enoyl-CoA hydratase family protein [Gordonia desulfuricans]WLP89266.1 crotonase/enoyl-CoA hydratase family protein [Gordonia sp. NB41Y]